MNQPDQDGHGDLAQRGRRATVRRVTRNLLSLIVGDAATKLALFGLYFIVARRFGAAGFGDFTLAISLAYFVEGSALGTDLILTRELSRDPDKASGLFWDSMILKVGAATPTLLVIVGYAVLDGRSVSVVVAVALLGLSNFVDVLVLSLYSLLIAREKMGVPAAALALENVALLVLGAVALLVFGGGLVELSIAYVVASFVALIYVGIAMERQGVRPRSRYGARRIRWLARAAVPTGVSSFLGVALARIDAIILAAITHDTVVVGLYGGAYRLFEATLFVSWAVGLALYPRMSNLRPRSNALARLFEVSTMAVSAITVPIGAALILFAPMLVRVAFGSAYAGADAATEMLGGAAALYGVFTVAAMVVASQDRQALFAWIGGIALVVDVALNFALIPSLSLRGAAIAMTAAQVVATAMTWWFAVRETGAVSVRRMFAAPSVGLGAMILARVLLGSSAATLVVSLVAFATAFLALELILHRDDLLFFLGVLRSRQGESRAVPEGPPVSGL